MAGDSPSLKQEDIEELLRQAQMASGLVPEGAGAPDDSELHAVDLASDTSCGDRSA